jgi:trimethylamine--corrinoid protein Co-methyltransferase
MSRYKSAFYRPLLSDWSNFGRWVENGAKDATRRASDIAKNTLAEFEPPPLDPAMLEELEEFKLRRTREGGAPPES